MKEFAKSLLDPEENGKDQTGNEKFHCLQGKFWKLQENVNKSRHGNVKLAENQEFQCGSVKLTGSHQFHHGNSWKGCHHDRSSGHQDHDIMDLRIDQLSS